MVRVKPVPIFKKRRIITALYFIFGIYGLWQASQYLLVSDKPFRSDVVVLFVGPGLEGRLLTARQLIKKGYADTLFIPDYQKSFKRMPDGEIESYCSSFFHTLKPVAMPSRRMVPQYYERTHVEIMESKRLMDQHGIRSALFVSSPYHMRRIQLISKKILNPNQYKVRFVPADYDGATAPSFNFKPATIRWIIAEYVKIGWLQIYSLFG